MSDITGSAGPGADITEEAARIIDAANTEGIPLRLLGGLAIFFQCPAAMLNERLQRTYKDMDFVTLSRWGAKTKALFTRLGYEGSKTFNALHGNTRLPFWDKQHERQIDIFIDRMQMCHTLDFRSRLLLDTRTLSPSDLLLTKLQIVEINEKDLIDAVALFYDHEVGRSEQGIDANYITGLTSNDWGLQKTQAFAIDQNFPSYIPQRINALLTALQERPKSLGWKARAVVGERMRWYELPEEVRQ